MNSSEEYLYNGFRKSYQQALKAKGAGDLTLTKCRLYEAADFLEQFARIVDEPRKSEHRMRAKRMRAVADSIEISAPAATVEIPYPEHQNQPDIPGNQELPPSRYEVPDAHPSFDSGGMEQFFTFFRPDELAEGFEGIIGLDEAKKAVTDYVINPIRYPDAYNYNFIDNKAVLLEGPPGTGKTTFAKAVAKEVHQPFALVNVAALVNCYIGETGKNIDKVFAYLRNYVKYHNCGMTVFFDELDEIAKSRGGDDKASASAVPALLRNLDGVKQNKSFLILANTNYKELLDKAILSRFRKQIYIPLPDAGMRKRFFEAKLADIEEHFMKVLDLDAASSASDGLSGRDITFICDDLKYYLAKVKSEHIKTPDLQKRLLSLIEERCR